MEVVLFAVAFGGPIALFAWWAYAMANVGVKK
ncbi:hypothetical protein QGX12_gp080 [Pseudomonas phage Kremar]|uniref:Uncharacterized protein n=1 Tax=Pseudomonas phage Kremar TaxID=2928831 RepID=A0AAE9GNT8_9CAUD|nr:hypothetical protein QGX12_gp080 [Pseudomonas phage Kremar]UOL48564.1 hypothetical protein [Pseudomonas phage Kremar]